MLDAAGVDAKIRVLPALGEGTPELKPFELRGRGTVDLDPGYWQLTAQPVKSSAVTVAPSQTSRHFTRTRGMIL